MFPIRSKKALTKTSDPKHTAIVASRSHYTITDRIGHKLTKIAILG